MAMPMHSLGFIRFRGHHRLLAAVALAGLVSSLLSVPLSARAEEPVAATESNIVEINDGALASCIADQVEGGVVGELTYAQLAGLTALSCADRSIRDVGPLQFATNLVQLNLSDNAIRDLSPLASLHSLTELAVDGQRLLLPAGEHSVPTGVPAVLTIDGSTVPVTLSAASPIVGILAENLVSWTCSGEGILEWSTTAPVGNSDVSAVFSGSILQQVANGDAGLCQLQEPTTPLIQGTATLGNTLTVDPGVWEIGSALTYQWSRGDVAVTGATAATYLVTDADLGQALTATVAGAKTGYEPRTTETAPTSVISGGTLTPGTISISGTPRVGQTLTVGAGTWLPAGVNLDYQWNRNGTSIAGATGASYVLVAEDSGALITVAVSGTKPGYTPLTTTSFELTVEKLFDGQPTPTISGAPRAGQTLTVRPGTWSPSSSVLTYQWTRGGTSISGATGTTYVVLPTDVGQAIAVSVTARASGYTTVTLKTASLTIERPMAVTPVPTVTGTGRVGQTLTATTAKWWPGGVTLKYQWKRNSAPISGATGSKYTLVTADAGASITVAVSGTKSGYTAVTKTSAARVVEKLLTATPVPSVSGQGRVGQKLSAAAGSWSPAKVTLTYRWMRNGVAIAGATASTYTLTTSDAGRSITVQVTGSKSGYTPVSKTSTGKSVEKLLTATPVPTITGSAKTGKKLTAKSWTWTPSPVALSYQWQRNGASISGATSSTYVLRGADVGKSISVVVRGSKSGYTPVSKTSARTGVVAYSIAIPRDGSYIVGSGVQPGTYATTSSTRYCEWVRVSDLTGSEESLIAYGYGSGQRIVTISATDAGFASRGCGSWIRLADKAPISKSYLPGEGIFVVGTDLKPGLYRASNGSGGCYWAALSGFSGETDDIIENAITTDYQPVVRIYASDVAFEVSGCGTWTRIGD